MTRPRLVKRESFHDAASGTGQAMIPGTSLVRWACAVGAVGTLFFVSACGATAEGKAALAATEQHAHAGHSGGSATSGAPRTLEDLAAKTDCTKLEIQGRALDMRQGACKTSKGQFTITTFSTDKGAQEWLSEAQAYGGTYLIGVRWIIVGTPTAVASFQGDLGGKLETVGHDQHA